MKFIHLCHDEHERCCYGYRLGDRRPKKPCSLRRRHDHLFPIFFVWSSKLRNYVSGGVSQEKKKDIISSQPTSQTNSTNSGQLARANRSR